MRFELTGSRSGSATARVEPRLPSQLLRFLGASAFATDREHRLQLISSKVAAIRSRSSPSAWWKVNAAAYQPFLISTHESQRVRAAEAGEDQAECREARCAFPGSVYSFDLSSLLTSLPSG